MSSTITIDAAGRLVLPKKMRDRLNLKAGSRLRVDLLGEKIELSAESDESCELVLEDGFMVIKGTTTADSAAAVKETRNDREMALAERSKQRRKS